MARPPLDRTEAIALALEEFNGNSWGLKILIACAERPHSAKDVAPFRKDLAIVAYHFNKLRKADLIVFDHAEQRRGATARFHKATPKGKRLLRRLGVGLDGKDAGA